MADEDNRGQLVRLTAVLSNLARLDDYFISVAIRILGSRALKSIHSGKRGAHHEYFPHV